VTTNQLKRIRAKLDQAARLAIEANELATDGHAEYELRCITARAADDMDLARRSLKMWESHNAAAAAAIARELEGERHA
jgi:hypothetical protein